jgi:hypothetical protein
MTDIENLNAKIQHIERGISGIEDRLRVMETTVALTRGEYESLQRFFESKFQMIEQAQKDTKSIISKLVWVIIVAIVMGVMQFVINGGLSNGLN